MRLRSQMKPISIAAAVYLILAVTTLAFAEAPAPAKTGSQQDKVDAIVVRKEAIEQEVATLNKYKTCAGDGECEVLEMGFRLCGGPSSYLVASVSNPTYAKLKAKLQELIAVEKELNLVDPPADCTPAPKAPDGVCAKQICKASDNKSSDKK
jgi:hypothetical protein